MTIVNGIMQINQDQLNLFERDFNNNLFPHERFGQAFLNYYFPSTSHPELFYETDRRKAMALIKAIYVAM